MSSKQFTLHHVTRRFARLLVLGAALSAPAALAASADLADLAAKPGNYLGQEVEVVGYCVKGGVKGNVLGYECITEGTVRVTADDIEPATAKEKLDVGCNGADAAQSEACRVTLRFEPHSYTTSSVIEPGKDIVVLNAKKAVVSF